MDGIIHHTTMTALANNWDFNPAMHRDGPGGKVHWDLKTNELYVKMVAPSASSTEFAVEDLKLVLRAVLNVASDPSDTETLSTDQIMQEVDGTKPDGILRLIRDLTLP